MGSDCISSRSLFFFLLCSGHCNHLALNFSVCVKERHGRLIAYLFTLHIRALVIVPCGGPKKSPRTFLLFKSSGVVCNHFSILF